MSAVVEWAEAEFDRFLFLIADDPHVHTLMATKGLSEVEARGQVDAIGREKRRLVERCVVAAGAEGCIVKSWREIDTSQFRALLAGIEVCFDRNVQFRADVLKQVHGRLREAPGGRREQSEIESDVLLAARYVLEELAVMVYLQEHAEPSWPVQVFPLPMPEALRGLYEHIYCEVAWLDDSRSGYRQIKVGA